MALRRESSVFSLSGFAEGESILVPAREAVESWLRERCLIRTRIRRHERCRRPNREILSRGVDVPG